MKKTTLILAIVIAAILAVFPAAVSAEAKSSDECKLVRVGWYESPFNRTDQFGRKSGYAYEYQRKIAAYTGWKYEYVEGSWSELMHKIERGEIDLMSDVSYMESRTKSMLYGSLPMGTETYYIFVASGNTEITAEDYKSLDGKKVGVTKDSVQESLFLDWEKKHGVKADLIETIVALVLLVILILLLRSIRLEKKAREEEHLVNNLNRQVFVDPLTSVRNKGAITNYINDIQGRIENGEKFDLAVGMFDCNDLKAVNDTYGQDNV